MLAYQCDRPGCGVLYEAREPRECVTGIMFYPRHKERIAHLCESCEDVYVRYWFAKQKAADGGA
jgi:hypothetical protein